MIVLSGAELVLPDRILSPGTLTIEGGRIVDIRPQNLSVGPDPLAEHSEPSHHATPDFEDPGSATFPDLVQKPAPGGLPHPRLEL